MAGFNDIAEYESIRVTSDTHKLRHSHHIKLIQSGPGQTLMLSYNGPYVYFRIVESGLEIPTTNVASAIPKAATLATRLRKTTGTRLTPKAPAPKKAKPAEEADDGEE